MRKFRRRAWNFTAFAAIAAIANSTHADIGIFVSGATPHSANGVACRNISVDPHQIHYAIVHSGGGDMDCSEITGMPEPAPGDQIRISVSAFVGMASFSNVFGSVRGFTPTYGVCRNEENGDEHLVRSSPGGFFDCGRLQINPGDKVKLSAGGIVDNPATPACPCWSSESIAKSGQYVQNGSSEANLRANCEIPTSNTVHFRLQGGTAPHDAILYAIHNTPTGYQCNYSATIEHQSHYYTGGTVSASREGISYTEAQACYQLLDDWPDHPDSDDNCALP